MTILTSNNLSNRSPALGEVTRIIRWMSNRVLLWATHYAQHREQRKAFATLSAFSDRELRDIGLNRSEIEAAVRSQLRNTPSKPAVDQSAEF